MHSYQVLNNIIHKDTKIITDYSTHYGDNVSVVETFPTEFGDVQKEYPIFFRKHPNSDDFQTVAMLGLFENQNLFLNDHADANGKQWNAQYIPAAIRRGPFAIGFQDQTADGGLEHAPVIHIDMDNPKVNTEEGQSVFLEHGGNSDYLDHINSTLLQTMDGLSLCKGMFAVFSEFDLIAPINLEVSLLEDQTHKLHGNYTIDAEKLKNLSAHKLKKLQNSGFLEAAYYIISSLANVQKLVNWQNDRAHLAV